MTWRTVLVAAALAMLVVALLSYLLAVTGYRAVHEPTPPDQRFVAASAGRAFVADMDGMPTTTTTVPPTTTTTTARARTAPTVRAVSRPAPAPAVYGSGACGGDLPPCSVMRRESGGNIRAINRTGCGGRGCYGKWQFDPVTFIPGCTVTKWEARTCGTYQGFQFASDAPEEVQDARARELWANGAGHSHWGV